MTRPLVERKNSAVYVIGHDDGPQKIGFSYSPHRRATALNKVGEQRMKVHGFAVVATTDALAVEALVHWMLRDQALGGERFDVAPNEAVAAVTEAARRFYDEGARAPGPNDPDRLNILATKGLVRRVNEWRARNGFVGKSEAGRVLIERALDAEDAALRRAERDVSPSPSRKPKRPPDSNPA